MRFRNGNDTREYNQENHAKPKHRQRL
jgi:hypothetical protein